MAKESLSTSISEDEASYPSRAIPNNCIRWGRRSLVACLAPQDLPGLTQPRTSHGCHYGANIADPRILGCHRRGLWIRKDVQLVGKGGVLFWVTSPRFKHRVREQRGTGRKASVFDGTWDAEGFRSKHVCLEYSIVSCWTNQPHLTRSGMDWLQS